MSCRQVTICKSSSQKESLPKPTPKLRWSRNSYAEGEGIFTKNYPLPNWSKNSSRISLSLLGRRNSPHRDHPNLATKEHNQKLTLSKLVKEFLPHNIFITWRKEFLVSIILYLIDLKTLCLSCSSSTSPKRLHFSPPVE